MIRRALIFIRDISPIIIVILIVLGVVYCAKETL